MNLELVFKPTDSNTECTAKWFFDVEKFRIGKKWVKVKVGGETFTYGRSMIVGAYQWKIG